MRFATPLLLIISTALLLPGCVTREAAETETPPAAPAGPFLGQSPPDSGSALFAPGIVSTGLYERDLAATPDGREVYWTVVLGNFAHTAIVGSRLADDGWTPPEVMPFAADPHFRTFEPFITPDGERFFFVSDRPLESGGTAREDENIWVMDRENGAWGPAHPLPAPVNTEAKEYFPSVTRDGTVYFTREGEEVENGLYRARYVDNGYAEPELLPAEVNAGRARFNAYVAPDESYLIVPIFGLEDSRGSTDYYICFRNEDDSWSEPVNLGDAVNSAGGQEYSPYVTPDGRFFFFMAARPTAEEDLPEALTLEWMRRQSEEPTNGLPNVYWMKAGFLERLRPR